MWPVIAIAAAGAIAQYMNSQAASKANKAELDQLHGLLNNLQSPHFDPSTITPAQYQLVQKYVPQVAPHIQELNPTVIKESPDMAEGRQAQLSALRGFQNIASQDNNPELQAMSQQALNQGQAAAQSRSASTLENFQRRGMLSGGSQLAAQLSGNEGAMQNASSAGQNAAVEAYRQRLAAMQTSAGLGGQIRSNDQSMQAQNAGIINSFNQRMAQSGQNYADYAAGTANDAQRANLANQQSISNANVTAGNDAAWRNKAYADQMAQLGFQNNMAKYGQTANIAGMTMGQNTQRAQDTNSAVQGLANAGIAGYGYSQNADASDKYANLQRQNAFYNKTGKAPGPGDYGYDEENK